MIKAWNDICHEYQNGDLIIGNGASVNIYPQFDYGQLCPEIDGKLEGELRRLFPIEHTIEEMLGSLCLAANIVKNLHCGCDVSEKCIPELRALYSDLRREMLSSLVERHPEHAAVGKKQFTKYWNFVEPFQRIASLNYDLFLYWTWAKYDFKNFIDCFNDISIEEAICNEHRIIVYPHGALYIYPQGKQRKPGKVSNPILLKLKTLIRDNKYPTVVLEGSSSVKKTAITDNDYLKDVYEIALPQWGKQHPLTIYGWSLSEQDSHILKQLNLPAVEKIAISVFGRNSQDAETNAHYFNWRLKHFGFKGSPVFFNSASAF